MEVPTTEASVVAEPVVHHTVRGTDGTPGDGTRTAYVQCVEPRGRAALRRRHVRHAGGYGGATRHAGGYGGPGTVRCVSAKGRAELGEGGGAPLAVAELRDLLGVRVG
eukprot:scaffold6704_cov39-Phaeocystis_antarctica.AAC.1